MYNIDIDGAPISLSPSTPMVWEALQELALRQTPLDTAVPVLPWTSARYRREGWYPGKRDHYRTAGDILAGTPPGKWPEGDCEDLAAWYVAGRWSLGAPAIPVVQETGAGWHALAAIPKEGAPPLPLRYYLGPDMGYGGPGGWEIIDPAWMAGMYWPGVGYAPGLLPGQAEPRNESWGMGVIPDGPPGIIELKRPGAGVWLRLPTSPYPDPIPWEQPGWSVMWDAYKIGLGFEPGKGFRYPTGADLAKSVEWSLQMAVGPAGDVMMPGRSSLLAGEPWIDRAGQLLGYFAAMGSRLPSVSDVEGWDLTLRAGAGVGPAPSAWTVTVLTYAGRVEKIYEATKGEAEAALRTGADIVADTAMDIWPLLLAGVGVYILAKKG